MGSTGKMVKKVAKKAAAKVEFPNNMIEKKPRVFSIGGDIRPSGDLTRFVKWPKYIRIQRSRRILYQRIKIPPAINQFKQTFDKRQAGQLFRLLNQLKPESKAAKAERLGDAAQPRLTARALLPRSQCASRWASTTSPSSWRGRRPSWSSSLTMLTLLRSSCGCHPCARPAASHTASSSPRPASVPLSARRLPHASPSLK